eukprot:CAMPEP_0202891396 /NCGR_PEP_ID=MMETSP1392-20130828/1468_1 /ASSEMBLY_ACC=CAM_ASM_000868 /TAXON_ID=225041 /ORGANISM="Chlamydomonas chlamydogama, Strain SAG 11-48b" /LENGTH=345 /DNA_ID=CAMNT_0049575133 /DNA_START=106 /DNA_END=1140 /DNA_ORIENTATION=+
MESYKFEVQRIQDAFLQAVKSSAQLPNAAVSALQSAFPSAQFSIHASGKHLTTGGVFTDGDRNLLDDVLRLLLVHLSEQAVAAGQRLMHFTLTGCSSPILRRLLDLVRWITEAGFGATASASTPTGSGLVRVLDLASFCRLVEDMLEIGTIVDCQDVFVYMEQNMEFLKSEYQQQQQQAQQQQAAQTAADKGGQAGGAAAPAKPTAQMNQSMLAILRACNNVLRRLSKATDVQLCGRVLVFMARLYPLSDRSGLNLQWAVNTGLPLPVDEVGPHDVDSSGQPIDPRLYTTMWGLQAVFKAPVQALQLPVWARVSSEISTVLDEFERLPITVLALGPAAAADVEGG